MFASSYEGGIATFFLRIRNISGPNSLSTVSFNLTMPLQESKPDLSEDVSLEGLDLRDSLAVLRIVRSLFRAK